MPGGELDCRKEIYEDGRHGPAAELRIVGGQFERISPRFRAERAGGDLRRVFNLHVRGSIEQTPADLQVRAPRIAIVGGRSRQLDGHAQRQRLGAFGGHNRRRVVPRGQPGVRERLFQIHERRSDHIHTGVRPGVREGRFATTRGDNVAGRRIRAGNQKIDADVPERLAARICDSRGRDLFVAGLRERRRLFQPENRAGIHRFGVNAAHEGIGHVPAPAVNTGTERDGGREMMRAGIDRQLDAGITGVTDPLELIGRHVHAVDLNQADAIRSDHEVQVVGVEIFVLLVPEIPDGQRRGEDVIAAELFNRRDQRHERITRGVVVIRAVGVLGDEDGLT